MKKPVRWLVVLVLAAWVIQDPAAASHLAHQAVTWLRDAGHSLSTLAAGL